MKAYESPNAELIEFGNDQLMTASGPCRCYLDIGVTDNYSDPNSGCWTDSEDASAYDMHDAGV